MVARRVGEKAKKLAAHLLEVSEDDVIQDVGKFYVKGAPDKVKTIQEVAFAAYTNFPQGMEAGLEANYYYDPPNLTYPFGTYVVAVEVDPDTGEWKVRRMVAVDDCGVRINPMIVEGQIHGGLTEGYGIAAMELIAEVRAVRYRHAVTAPPDRGEGRRRVGHRRFAGRVRQRRDRRAVARGREKHRHAHHLRQGVGGAPDREGRRGRLTLGGPGP
jgi:hypothetical protein